MSRITAGTWGYEPWAGDAQEDNLSAVLKTLKKGPAYKKLRDLRPKAKDLKDESPVRQILLPWDWVGEVYLVSDALQGVPESLVKHALEFVEGIEEHPAYEEFLASWKEPEEFPAMRERVEADLRQALDFSRDGRVRLTIPPMGRLAKYRQPPLGPRQDLVDKIRYRVRSNSDGIVIALYSGRRSAGAMVAHWKRFPGDLCVSDIGMLSITVTPTPQRILQVYTSGLEEGFRGLGYGRAMYQALMAEGWKQEGRPFFLTPMWCSYGSGTSAMAMRVWDSLARQYPSSGKVIAVTGPVKPGVRTSAGVVANRWLGLHE